MRRLCTICARGGSKGLAGKNLRRLAGLPLLAHSIRQARATGLFDAIAVSSDSAAILAAARRHGADVLVRRPVRLATDRAPKIPAIRHCVLAAERALGRRFDILVDLDATSPLRLPADIAGAVRLLERRRVANVITGAPARRSPYFNLVELDRRGVARLAKVPRRPVRRRQDAPRCYDMNASIYVWRRAALFARDTVFFGDTLLYEMPAERSVDIDDEMDFDLVKMLMSRRGQRTRA